MLSLLYSRKKKRGTLDTIVILVVLGMSLGLSLTACGGTTPPPPTVNVNIIVPPSATSTSSATLSSPQIPGTMSTPVTGVTSNTCTQTTITLIPTPNANGDNTIYGVDNRRKEFLTDILYESQQGLLVPGFPPGLFLAVALAEGAADGNGDPNWAWSNQHATGGGLMQVTQQSGCWSQNPPQYNDTHDGYLQNVHDAMCVLAKGYNVIATGGDFNNYNNAFSGVPNWVNVLTVLHYNATSDPIKEYQNRQGTEEYLSQVAKKIPHVPNVSSDFGCQFQINSQYADDLNQGQAIVYVLIKTWTGH